MALAQVIDHRFQNVLRDGDGVDNVPDLIHDDFFRYPDFPGRVLRVAGDQVDVFPLFQVAGYPAARQGAGNQAVQGKGLCRWWPGPHYGGSACCKLRFAGFKQGFINQGEGRRGGIAVPLTRIMP
jgi:hypothetical protein